MEWKEIKDGKPVEEGVEKAPEEKPEVAENATEVKPEVKAQEPVEQKPEAPAKHKPGFYVALAMVSCFLNADVFDCILPSWIPMISRRKSSTS